MRIDSIPTGLRPVGMDINFPFAAVANSGDDSVSVFELLGVGAGDTKRVSLVTTIRGIPAPHGLSFCTPGATGVNLLVTSPSDNSVSVVRIPEGTVSGRIQVGPEPYSVACYLPSIAAVISNAGDNSVSLV